MSEPLLDYLKENFDSMTRLSLSTNDTRFFRYDGRGYVAKRQALQDGALSPFWRRMRSLFGWSFAGQRRALPEICRLLGENPVLPVARCVLSDEAARMSVFTEMPGDAWEPDEFPDSDAVALRLGRFIGFAQTRTWPHCGLLGGEQVTDIGQRLLRCAEERRAEGVVPTPEEARAIERLRREGLKTSGFSLIMTDISANQFLFDEKGLAALVDLDAYVIGPREWELRLLMDCVPNLNALQTGYQAFLPWPDMEETGPLYAYLMREA